MITLLEDLPNELLLDVFEYISGRDLYYSFLALNSRINYIVRSLKNLSLMIYKNEPLLIQTFADKIFRLQVSNHYDITDIDHFPNLRSLSLYNANDKQLDQIRYDCMPNLMYLFILIPDITESSEKLARNIFSNQLPSLRYADLGLIDVNCISLSSWSPSLSVLRINCTKSVVIRMVLLVCPNLKRFQVNLLKNNSTIVTQLPTKTLNHNLKTFILVVSCRPLPLETIDDILLGIPNVTKMYLHWYCDTLFVILARMLSERLKYLRQFGCNIIEFPNDIKHNNIKSIREIHSSFNSIQCTTTYHGFRLFTADGFPGQANLFG
ncbi:unnamed protein product [Rotaria magnacalcarata]|uniref:F-box domain-containing protein n=1 Tax=Rotaria magnacalcarata TaxID=392030 RepID=A0A815QCK1_9BILA|nr:unnamed protein product [Rotaria magnacalcarata]CAF1675569.1 unnamed protein product [Rotaria magnacalcarata]CAF4046956.1 unnamed protein product [Rotaria magnacalcarata]CAF4077305.1 unnamed protein product [Rotaria magnacalcarata]